MKWFALQHAPLPSIKFKACNLRPWLFFHLPSISASLKESNCHLLTHSKTKQNKNQKTLQKEPAVSDKALHKVGGCFGTRPEGHLRLCGSAELPDRSKPENSPLSECQHSSPPFLVGRQLSHLNLFLANSPAVWRASRSHPESRFVRKSERTSYSSLHKT